MHLLIVLFFIFDCGRPVYLPTCVLYPRHARYKFQSAVWPPREKAVHRLSRVSRGKIRGFQDRGFQRLEAVEDWKRGW